MATMKDISSIKVGSRYRKELGDLESLVASIKEVGLLHPIVVTKEGRLVAGARRLKAMRKLGHKKIPVTVVNLDEIVRGEYAENAERKDFLPSEINAIRLALEPKVKAEAKKRMAAAGPKEGKGKKKGTGGGKLPQPVGKTRDQVGAFAGVSGRTVQKIAVVHAAAKEDPKTFGDLPAEMDRTGKVDSAYAKVSRKKRHQKIATAAAAQSTTDDGKPATAPTGPFSLFYADPPWKWGHFGEADKENEAGKGRTPDQHYPTLTYDEINNFRVCGKLIREIAHRDAALLLWCTSANIEFALQVVKAWGFEYKAQAVWVKDRSGMGLIFRNRHEVLLYATRGKMPGPQFQPQSVFEYPRGAHSAKPPEIRTIIEKMYPDFDEKTRIELFARETPKGWTAYGFESKGAVAA